MSRTCVANPISGVRGGTTITLARESGPVDIVTAVLEEAAHAAPAPTPVHRAVDKNERGHLDPSRSDCGTEHYERREPSSRTAPGLWR